MITKQVFDVKKIKTRKAGGWDKCLGPFTTEQARIFGIDEWQCDGNCYIRIDNNGSKYSPDSTSPWSTISFSIYAEETLEI